MLSTVVSFVARALGGRRPDATRAFGASLPGDGRGRRARRVRRLVSPVGRGDGGALPLRPPRSPPPALVFRPRASAARPLRLGDARGDAVPLRARPRALRADAPAGRDRREPPGRPRRRVRVALPLCLAHALLAPWPAAERGCALVASGALRVVRWIARGFAGIPSLSAAVPTPTSWQLVAIAVGLVGAVIARRGWRGPIVAIAGAVVLVAEIGARRAGCPVGVLRVTFLDVGQGDAALVDLPDGSAALIDGGGLVGSPVRYGRASRRADPSREAPRRARPRHPHAPTP